MKFRRDPQPQPSEADTLALPFAAALFQAVEDHLALCAELTERRDAGATGAELRADALAGARRIAYVSRMTNELLVSGALDPTEISASVLPLSSLELVARLGYALVGLAEDDPEPEELLTQEEIAALPNQYGLTEWIELYRPAAGKASGR